MAALVSAVLLALAQTGWKPYALDGFGVELPSPPVETHSPSAPKGVRCWISRHNGKNAIVVTTGSLDAKASAEPGGSFAGTIAGTLGPDGRLTEERDALVQGWPALDFRFVLGESRLAGTARVVAVGGRIVLLSVAGPSDAAIKGAYDLVVASLRLPTGSPNGPRTQPGPTFERTRLGESAASVEMPCAPQTRTAPVNDRPDAAVAHTFVAPYANRLYLAQYADVPEKALHAMQETRRTWTGSFNSLTTRSWRASKPRRRPPWSRGSTARTPSEASPRSAATGRFGWNRPSTATGSTPSPRSSRRSGRTLPSRSDFSIRSDSRRSRSQSLPRRPLPRTVGIVRPFPVRSP